MRYAPTGTGSRNRSVEREQHCPEYPAGVHPLPGAILAAQPHYLRVGPGRRLALGRGNGSLIAGGVCLAAFTLGLGALLHGWCGALLLLLGGITGIAVVLVGVFPVDHPLHQVVGPAAFLAGLLSCGLFTVSLMSMPLLLPDGMNQIFAAPDAAGRPAVWVVAIAEWPALWAVLLWVGSVAGYAGYVILRRTSPAGNTGERGGREQTMTWTADTGFHPSYHSSRPVAALAPFVDIIWLHESYAPSSQAERILPTGTVELVINLRGGVLRVADGHHPQRFQSFHGAVVCGPHATSFAIDTSQPAALLGLHFKPGGAFPFFPVPAEELHNRHVALSDLWGAGAAELLEQLSAAPTVPAAFRIVEQALPAQATRPLALHPAVAFALHALQSGAHPPTIAAVTDQIGLSSRRFSRLFREQVGLTPKRFSRVQRFQSVLGHIQTAHQVHWADVALACGYFDQAHFVHDFRAFSGFTPLQYLEQRTSRRNHLALGR
jgi:AraC-like DNA-binding protein